MLGACRALASAPRGILLSSSSRLQSTLVLADHNGEGKLNGATLSAVAAAKAVGGDGVACLVAGGAGCADVAKELASADGVSKVLVAESPDLKGFLPERLAPVVLAAQKQFGFTHVLAPACAVSRAALPVVAAKLDVSPISDIVGVKDADTFVRTVYAGNAVMTLKASDPVKIITVRTTSFEPVATGSGSGAEEKMEVPEVPKNSEFIGQELSKSDRPELSSASVSFCTPKAFAEGNGPNVPVILI